MSGNRTLIVVALAVGLPCGVGGVIFVKRQVGSDAVRLKARIAAVEPPQAESEARSAAVLVVPQEMSAPPENAEELKPITASGPTKSGAPTTTAQANPIKRPAKEPWRDPVARVALAFVGMDADAEAYWYGAINDPSLPPNERQDLIEDLNEDGLSDPKHPTADDLPLIVDRLLIIEEVGWDAMDEVNADAFWEAY